MAPCSFVLFPIQRNTLLALERMDCGISDISPYPDIAQKLSSWRA